MVVLLQRPCPEPLTIELPWRINAPLSSVCDRTRSSMNPAPCRFADEGKGFLTHAVRIFFIKPDCTLN